jgi:hypothetical protein
MAVGTRAELHRTGPALKNRHFLKIIGKLNAFPFVRTSAGLRRYPGENRGLEMS